MNGNMLIKNASQLVTCSGFAAKQGKTMSNLHVIEDGAVVIENGFITHVGPTSDILSKVDEKQLQKQSFDIIDATNKAALPGFVDSHTHLVFGGYRAEEFSWRLKGDTYMDIMKKGGGIVKTVAATQKASKAELIKIGLRRLDAMVAFGVTTIESKSGYGLDKDTEIKQLEVMAELNKQHPVDVVSTFLGAHAVPGDYKEKKDDYITFIIDQVLPTIAKNRLAEFCDVFCEKDVFSINQSRRLLLKAKDMGFKTKIHADEITPLGGAELAAEVGAVSADHLLSASDQGIQEMAKKGVVATLLPGTAFSLNEPYARARYMIDQNCAVALATDFNPGSCFTYSIPLIAVLAALRMKMTPEEVISALTINAAAALDRADQIGSIDAGKIGDLVILEYPSYEFILYHMGVNTVETVIKKGTIIKK